MACFWCGDYDIFDASHPRCRLNATAIFCSVLAGVMGMIMFRGKEDLLTFGKPYSGMPPHIVLPARPSHCPISFKTQCYASCWLMTALAIRFIQHGSAPLDQGDYTAISQVQQFNQACLDAHKWATFYCDFSSPPLWGALMAFASFQLTILTIVGLVTACHHTAPPEQRARYAIAIPQNSRVRVYPAPLPPPASALQPQPQYGVPYGHPVSPLMPNTYGQPQPPLAAPYGVASGPGLVREAPQGTAYGQPQAQAASTSAYGQGYAQPQPAAAVSHPGAQLQPHSPTKIQYGQPQAAYAYASPAPPPYAAVQVQPGSSNAPVMAN